MDFPFSKNVHFTRLVKTADRLREFNFRRIPGNDNALFHVDVPDDRGNRIVFRMHRDDHQWHIVERHLPNWICDHEQRLNDLIEEEVD